MALKEYDFDIILVALYDDAWMCDYLEYELLIKLDYKILYSGIIQTVGRNLYKRQKLKKHENF